jgi:diguanylate cyclase (GGDEF)-like protein
MFHDIGHFLWKPASISLFCVGILFWFILYKPVFVDSYTLGYDLLEEGIVIIALFISFPIFLPSHTSIPQLLPSHGKRGRVVSESSISWLLSLAILSYLIGGAIWIVNEDVLHLTDLFPSWADAGYLAFYPFTFLAILLLPQQDLPLTSRVRIILDALITMIGVVTISWFFILGPILQAGTDSIVGLIIGTAYPLADIALFLGVFLLLIRNDSPIMQPVIVLLCLSIFVIICSDTIFDYQSIHNIYETGGLLDLGWPVSYLLMGLAARSLNIVPYLKQLSYKDNLLTASQQKQTSLMRLMLPYVWSPIIALLLCYIWRFGSDPFLVTGVIVGTVVLLFVILIRQLLAMRELHQLYTNNTTLISENTQLEVLSTHDSLTGLPNQLFLYRRLGQIVANLTQENASIALLLVELERIESVSDMLGRDMGDEVLQHVSTRLEESFPCADFIARLEGKEFGVVLPTTSAIEATELAQLLLNTLTLSFVINGHELSIGGSIGIALAPEHSRDVKELVRYADIAMHIAKRSQQKMVLYTSEIGQHESRRFSLMNELQQAISANELTLSYQPQISLANDQVVGVEALVRWPHKVRGAIFPDEFIPLAEYSGAIVPLTYWVLDQAISQCRAWEQKGIRVQIAVNLSTRTLFDPNLFSRVQEILQTHALDPERLTLEITESAVMDEPDQVITTLKSLCTLGIKISIDDFGTGYSSLSYLKRLPLNEIKVDKVFVLKLGEDASSADLAIIKAVIAMAEPLQATVVAEGVEDWETYTKLRTLGCAVAQGYYFSRPVPAVAFEDLVRNWPWWKRNGETQIAA